MPTKVCIFLYLEDVWRWRYGDLFGKVLKPFAGSKDALRPLKGAEEGRK